MSERVELSREIPVVARMERVYCFLERKREGWFETREVLRGEFDGL